MDSKEQLLNGLKQVVQLSSAGIKKLGELVSALTKFLNAKAEEKRNQIQQQQTQQKICSKDTNIVNCLMLVFQNTLLPVGLQSVLTLTPLYQNQVNGNIYDFGYSWSKNTTHGFAQIQCASIVTKLNQMLLFGGCNYTIHQMLDKGVYFEIIIRTTI